MYGLGMLMLEMPVLIIINTWFVRRRGLAFRILCGVTDLSGVGWTFLGSYMLDNHGTRTTFLVFAAISFFIPGIALCFIRRRPSAEDSASTSPSEEEVPGNTETPAEDAPTNLPRYYRRMSFYTLTATNLLQSLAFYLPFIYLPSYTTMLGYTASRGTVVLAVANVAQVIGEIGFGRLSDK
jgi:Cu2+-exporting ATPase